MFALRASTRVLKNPGTPEAARRIADYKNPSTAKSYGRRWDEVRWTKRREVLCDREGKRL